MRFAEVPLSKFFLTPLHIICGKKYFSALILFVFFPNKMYNSLYFGAVYVFQFIVAHSHFVRQGAVKTFKSRPNYHDHNIYPMFLYET